MSAAPGLQPARRGLVAPAATAWGYVRHELLFLSLALMEIGLLTPFVLGILGWARYWPPLGVTLWLLLTMLLPLNIVRLMSLLHVGMSGQRRALILALLLIVLLSWRQLLYAPTGLFDFSWVRQFAASLGEAGNLIWARDLSVFLITIFVWWRGIRLAGRAPEINNIGLRLRLGGLIIAPVVVWFGSSFLNTSVVPFILMFFLAGLTAVALVRAENVEQVQRGTSSTLSARWFAVVAAAAVAIVLGGGVIAAFVSGDSLYTVLAWLSPLWRALQFGGTVIFAVVFDLVYPAFEVLAVVVGWLGGILAQLMGFVAEGMRNVGILADLQPPELPTATPTPAVGNFAFTGKSLTIIVMLGLIVLVGLGLARVYQRATFAARESERSRERLANEDEEPGLGRRVLERLGLLRQWRAAASVRRIYRLMCRAAAAAGYPRLEAETPYEYAPTAAKVWPDYSPEVRLITEAFVRVRYGEAPETSEELEQIREAWRRLEATEPQRRDLPGGQGRAPTLAKRE